MKIFHLTSLIALAAIVLTGCGGGKNNMSSSSSSMSSLMTSSIATSSAMSSAMSSSSVAATTQVSYRVKVQNLTAGQPLSPIAVLLHEPHYHVFELGAAASVAVEKIAESGDASDFLAMAEDESAIFATERAEGLTMPGTSVSLTVSAVVDNAKLADLTVSLISMLGKTNDALTAVDAAHVGDLDIGDSITIDTLSYDAGTEANTETPSTLGALEGEGFNAMRDDVMDKVTLHPGVVTQDDGLATSGLTQKERWDNPVARVTITRL